MKHCYLTLIALLLSLVGVQAQNNKFRSPSTISDNMLRLSGWTTVPDGYDAFKALYPDEEWPVDENFNKAACVRFNFVNLSVDDINDLQYSFGNNVSVLQVDPVRIVDGHRQAVVFVSTCRTTATLEVVQKRYNYHSNIVRVPRLDSKTVYDVTVTGMVTTPIAVDVATENATDRVEVTLDGNKRAEKGVIRDVTMGTHTLRILVNGRRPAVLYDSEGKRLNSDRDVEIEVSNASSNLRFSFDARRHGTLKLDCDRPDAVITVDGKPLPGGRTSSVELPYGSYVVSAKAGDREDSRSVVINSPVSGVRLQPVKQVEFVINCYYKGYRTSGSWLSIDGSTVDSNNPHLVSAGDGFWRLRYPEDSEIKAMVSYNGFSKKKTIHVKAGMKQQIDINVKSGSHGAMYYDYKSWTFDFAYLQKTWRTSDTHGSSTVDRWFSEGDVLHGGSMTIGYRPAWPVGHIGLGFATGLGCELYYSDADRYYGPDGRDMFVEIDMVIPVHAQIVIPMHRNKAFFLEGGIGLDYAVYGGYGYDSSNSDLLTDVYGDGYPKRFNLSWELAAAIRLGVLNLKFLWSRGITDHEFTGTLPTHQNKWGVTVGFAF